MNFHREPIRFVGQVNLKIQNLKRSITFYKEVIGFKVLEQTSRSATFSADGKTALLSVEQPDNVVHCSAEGNWCSCQRGKWFCNSTWVYFENNRASKG